MFLGDFCFLSSCTQQTLMLVVPLLTSPVGPQWVNGSCERLILCFVKIAIKIKCRLFFLPQQIMMTVKLEFFSFLLIWDVNLSGPPAWLWHHIEFRWSPSKWPHQRFLFPLPPKFLLFPLIFYLEEGGRFRVTGLLLAIIFACSLKNWWEFILSDFLNETHYGEWVFHVS